MRPRKQFGYHYICPKCGHTVNVYLAKMKKWDVLSCMICRHGNVVMETGKHTKDGVMSKNIILPPEVIAVFVAWNIIIQDKLNPVARIADPHIRKMMQIRWNSSEYDHKLGTKFNEQQIPR